ncbi:DUF1310 family protein [Streptococcus ferus]|uniref:Lmo2807 protein n=1 Tax=Streptococcus ferus TaxID=1345 RepID=A0A2X3VG98_9STRE|nr:DUF1310 family protein [Streptococcus ferus]SQF40490.1 Lmo2807 protein [Streptococcus ferus]
MSKKVKIILAVIATVVITIGGGIAYMQHREHEKMVAIATSPEARKVYEDYLKNEDPNAFTGEGFIHSYQVEKSSLDYNPMGGLMVTLIINEDKKMDVGLNLIENEDGTYYSAYYTSSPKFWKTQEKYYGKEE